MREILPGIFTWPWYSERFQYDFHGYLLHDAAGAIVIDPVEIPDAVLDELAHEGVTRIVLTNRNHFRDAEKLRARTGAKVHVHPADAAFVRGKGVTVEGELWPGERVGPLTVVAANGKSPGEVALLWPERRILFIGDACVGNQPGTLGLLPAAAIDDAVTLRASLRRIAAELDFDTLLLGDGHPILTGARAALQTLVRSWGEA